MRQKLLSHFRLSGSRLSAFARADGGGVTVFAVIAFAMLMVIVGLIVDIGRVMNVHSQANSYADRVALAAAAELDNRPGALARAITAAQGAKAQVEPGFRFTLSNDGSVGVQKLTFMSALGPDPEDPYARSPTADDVVTAVWTEGGGLAAPDGSALEIAQLEIANRETAFVLVDTTQETEDYVLFPLLAALVPGMQTSATVAPQAIAGFERQVCNAPPLMICNINEATQGVGAPFSPVPGQMIRAKMQGSGAGWAPGVFGVLDAPNGSGASAIRDYMARTEPNTFCVKGTVDVKPGQNTGPIKQGMNVRFDMYDGAMNTEKNDTSGAYAPAANVTKGLRNNCNGNKSNSSTPMPRDNCFMPSGAWPNGVTASVAGTGCVNYAGVGRAGDGNWDRENYWSTNHSGVAMPTGYLPLGMGPGWTRYQTYRYEIDHPQMVDTAQEDGAPSCSASPAINDPARDRRVIPIAVINCRQYESTLNGSASDVPVEAYAEAFLTEPVGNVNWWNASNDDVFLEIIGVVRPNLPASVLREYPVLYR